MGENGPISNTFLFATVIICTIAIVIAMFTMPKGTTFAGGDCDIAPLMNKLDTMQSCPEVNIDCLSCKEYFDPGKIKEVTKFKYVCKNDAVVDRLEDCLVDREFTLEDAPSTNFYLEEVYIEPACTYGANGGEVYWRIGTTPQKVVLQVREPLAETPTEYIDVATFDNRMESFKYFDFETLTGKVDFHLSPSNVYIARMMWDLDELGVEYSQEFLIDAREGSNYMVQACGS